eukprot:g38721.t1
MVVFTAYVLKRQMECQISFVAKIRLYSVVHTQELVTLMIADWLEVQPAAFCQPVRCVQVVMRLSTEIETCLTFFFPANSLRLTVTRQAQQKGISLAARWGQPRQVSGRLVRTSLRAGRQL